MSYYNYHAIAKRLIREGRLTEWRLTECYRGICPALLLFFDDPRHPVMPIREYRWDEYLPLLEAYPQKTAPPPSPPESCRRHEP